MFKGSIARPSGVGAIGLPCLGPATVPQEMVLNVVLGVRDRVSDLQNGTLLFLVCPRVGDDY